MSILSDILLGLGIFVCVISVIGLLRFPDVYTRLHAGTKATTLGSLLVVSGIIVGFLPEIDDSEFMIIIHALIAVMLIIFTNPISAHAIARAAMLAGIKPAMAEVDEYNSPSHDISVNDNDTNKSDEVLKEEQ